MEVVGRKLIRFTALTANCNCLTRSPLRPKWRGSSHNNRTWASRVLAPQWAHFSASTGGIGSHEGVGSDLSPWLDAIPHIPLVSPEGRHRHGLRAYGTKLLQYRDISNQ